MKVCWVGSLWASVIHNTYHSLMCSLMGFFSYYYLLFHRKSASVWRVIPATSYRRSWSSSVWLYIQHANTLDKQTRKPPWSCNWFFINWYVTAIKCFILAFKVLVCFLSYMCCLFMTHLSYDQMSVWMCICCLYCSKLGYYHAWNHLTLFAVR